MLSFVVRRESAESGTERLASCDDHSASASGAGFTLLELVTAVLLLSLVMSLLFGALFQLTRGSSSLQQELEIRQELRVLLKRISEDLQALQYLPEAAKQNRPSGLFASRESSGDLRTSHVRFHAAVPSRFQRETTLDPYLHELAYRVDEDRQRDETRLLRREDFYIDGDIESGGIEAVLARDIQRFDVEFLPPGVVDSDSWQNQWDSRDYDPNRAADDPNNQARPLPRAIRITLGKLSPAGRLFEESWEFNLLQSDDLPAT